MTYQMGNNKGWTVVLSNMVFVDYLQFEKLGCFSKKFGPENYQRQLNDALKVPYLLRLLSKVWDGELSLWAKWSFTGALSAKSFFC